MQEAYRICPLGSVYPHYSRSSADPERTCRLSNPHLGRSPEVKTEPSIKTPSPCFRKGYIKGFKQGGYKNTNKPFKTPCGQSSSVLEVLKYHLRFKRCSKAILRALK